MALCEKKATKQQRPLWRLLLTIVAFLAVVRSAAAESVPILVPPGQPPLNVGLPAVGVMLPLSGRYQAFGESCLRGIQLALGAVEQRTPVVRTVILDTKGEAQSAIGAYQQLAADPGVVAVLGPMLSAEVGALQPYAQSFGLATLDFSQRSVGMGGPLFRFTLAKEDQAAVLAQYAVGERGLKRWASFHPDDAFGREISSAFQAAVETLGGRVVADVGYDPTKNDLQTEAKQLQAKIGGGENEPPRIDGVFLPDAAARVALLVSYLTSIDLRGVQLLGTSGWNRPQELLAAGPAIDGAVFVDGFFVYSFRPEVRSFVDAFRDAYHTDPGTLEAYGYDAAMIARDLIANGAGTRPGALAALRRSGSRRGATGDMAVTADGRIQKGLFLVKVDGGTIREVETSSAPVTLRDPSRAPAVSATPWRRPDWDSRRTEDRIGR